MNVRPLQQADLPALHSLYVDVTHSLPHGFPPSLEEFADALRTPAPVNLCDSAILVAEQWRELVGFVRLGLHVPNERFSLASSGQGMLLGPFVRPAHRVEGETLLQVALGELKARGASSFCAFDPGEGISFPFYNAGFCGLSERLPHIIGLLVRNGFRVRHRELCLTRPDIPASAPPLVPPGFDLRHARRGKNRYSIELGTGGMSVGACHYSQIFPARSRQTQAQRWGYIDGLGVSNDYQGRGLGRLLMLHAIADLQERGCGPVCLTTAAENYRAQNLYYSLGFALVDSCLTLMRPLP